MVSAWHDHWSVDGRDHARGMSGAHKGALLGGLVVCTHLICLLNHLEDGEVGVARLLEDVSGRLHVRLLAIPGLRLLAHLFVPIKVVQK